MRTRNIIHCSPRRLTAASALAAASALLVGGTFAPTARAATTDTPAYTAISNTGVLADTTTGSGTTATLNGSTLATGVTLAGAGLDSPTEESVDPDDSTANILSVGPDTGSPPTGAGNSISVSLPAATQPLAVHESGLSDHLLSTPQDFAVNGVATSATSLTDTDAGVQSVTNGARLLTVFNGADAPQQITYNMTLPAGAQLVPASDNLGCTSGTACPDIPASPTPMTSYVIVQNDAVIGEIDAPWATDANGNAVPTTYSISNNQLVQTVNFTSATPFPVVADPSVSFGWYIYVRWNKTEVHNIHNRLAAAAAAITTICQPIPNATARTICEALTTFTFVHIAGVFSQASSENRCVEIRFPYSPYPYFTRIYAC